jgi:tRNA nucleotidyltransferase (CCA-adding enzyme)
VVDLIARHMTPLEPDPKILRRRLGKWGVEATFDLLALQRADLGSKGVEEPDVFAPVEDMIRKLLEEKACLTVKDLAISGKDLLAAAQADPRTRYAYIIEGQWVHVDVL